MESFLAERRHPQARQKRQRSNCLRECEPVQANLGEKSVPTCCGSVEHVECIDPDGETARASWGLRLSLEGRSYGLRVRGREATVSGRAAPVEVHSNCCVPATPPLKHPQ